MTHAFSVRGFVHRGLSVAVLIMLGTTAPQDVAAQEEIVANCCVCADSTCKSAAESACAAQCAANGGVQCSIGGDSCPVSPAYCGVNLCSGVPSVTPTQSATSTVPTNTPTQTATNTVPTATRTQTSTSTVPTTTSTPTVTNTVPTSTPTQTATNTVPTATRTQTSTSTVPTTTSTPTVTNTVPTSTPTQTATNTVPTGTPTPQCKSDLECDDGVPCTVDTCDAGVCRHTPDDAQCDDGNVCTSDTCNAVTGCVNTFEDADGDGICNALDPHPNIFDPTGCLYDENTGKVVRGGLVSVAGPDVGRIHIGLNGSTGCYQFSVSGLPADPNSELYTLTIAVPPNCVRSTTCLEDPNAPLDPPQQLSPLILGPFNVAGYINPHDCGSNPFYLSFQLSDGDATVLNNNIPLQCGIGPVPAPAMSPWGLAAGVLLLAVCAYGALRLRRNER
jgi:hypothetical protein